MSDILATNDAEAKALQHLLHKQMPTHRKAYSDRTAWLMACCSELAYIKYNPLLPKTEQKDYFLKQVETLMGEQKKSALIKLIDLLGYDHKAEKAKLINELQLLNMNLLETYDKNGSQAILLSYDDYLVLAFRGTEPTSVKDIRSDAEGNKTPWVKDDESKGFIHSGFKKAYEQIGSQIQDRLNEEDCRDKPLFITGHSLGGSLATIATKALNHQGKIAACYTFGCPRVGDATWIGDIKDPLYRVVNAADAVTMLPPGDLTVSILGWLAKLIPQFGKSWSKTITSSFGGYMHCGDMRYLENIAPGQFKEAKLLYSVSLYYRLKGLFFFNRFAWGKPLSDHSISVYRKKLEQIAENRNPDNADIPDNQVQ